MATGRHSNNNVRAVSGDNYSQVWKIDGPFTAWSFYLGGASGTVYLQFSNDGVTWFDSSPDLISGSKTISAFSVCAFNIERSGSRYARINSNVAAGTPLVFTFFSEANYHLSFY